MAEENSSHVSKPPPPVEKAEPDAFVVEVAEDHQNEGSAPPDDTEIYQFLVAYQERNAGRLVLDPRLVRGISCTPGLQTDVHHRSAPAEFGDYISKRLKLSPDGSKILWPQPTDDPHDPQNVSPRGCMYALLRMHRTGSGVRSGRLCS